MTAAIGNATTTLSSFWTVGPSLPTVIKNQGPATVFLDFQVGGSASSITADQSATGGFPLEPGETILMPGIPVSPYYTVWGVTAEGTAVVSALG